MPFPPVPIEGEPQYVPMTPDLHTDPYGSGNTGLSAAAPGAPAKRCDPLVGRWLVGAALLAVLAVFLPWFHLDPPVSPDFYGGATTGDERGGLVTILLSLGILAAGTWIASGRGNLWSPIGALVASALTMFLLLLDLAGRTLFNALTLDAGSTIEVSYGFWLEGVASVAALGLSIAALARRRPVG